MKFKASSVVATIAVILTAGQKRGAREPTTRSPPRLRSPQRPDAKRN
jgi:hypothetical protein